jgi:tRNA (guanine37-N1)-methyltransferase
MGGADSAVEESFSAGLLEYPQYTRPADWNGRAVPAELLSGHHAAIEKWRRAQAEQATKTRRPELWTEFLQNAESGLAQGSQLAYTPPKKRN